MRDSGKWIVFYLANGTKVLCISSMLVHKTLHTRDLRDAVLRQGFRIISYVEYIGTVRVFKPKKKKG